jgi:hypothetical protein
MKTKAVAKYLNVSQLARKLDVPLSTLKDRMDRGVIKPNAIDGQGRWLFDLAELARIREALTDTVGLKDFVC